MSEVGYVPGGFGLGKQDSVNPHIGKKVISRLPVNPMDKSTLVSIMPKEIKEVKPTLFPSTFIIGAAGVDDFTILIVEPASWYMNSTIDRMPPTEVQVNSYQLVESIVRDFNSSVYLCDMNTRMPGLFAIPGEWDKKSIFSYTDRKTGKSFQVMLNEARIKQNNWFAEVIKSADRDWAKTNGNPLSIPDDARIACDRLGLSRPWIDAFKEVSMINCPYCGERVNPNYPTCKHCHKTINAERAAELDKSFAFGA